MEFITCTMIDAVEQIETFNKLSDILVQKLNYPTVNIYECTALANNMMVCLYNLLEVNYINQKMIDIININDQFSLELKINNHV